MLTCLLDFRIACRTCILALNAELSRVVELQSAFRQLSYFDFRRRSRLTLELARIAISLPVTLDKALQRQKVERDYDSDEYKEGIGGSSDEEYSKPLAAGETALLNRRVYRLLRGFAVVLERMEQML